MFRHRTVKYTSQHNEVAERMNRTLLENVRCMLYTSGLSKHLLREVLNAVVYLINRNPLSILEFKCIKKIWIGRKPGLDHLRVIDYGAYAHIVNNKLDLKS